MTSEAMATFNSFFRLVILLGTKISTLGLGQETPPDAQGYDPEASITGLYTGPYFDPLAPRNFTAHLGDQAILPCTVRQLGDKSVSWVRMRDADILTVDRYTFVGDERFESHYSAPLETWNLVIKYVQERDAGLYECQVSTEPKMSQFFSLRVVVPKVEILPPGDRYVKAGSEVRIECQITDVVQLPDYIFWYHEEKRVMDHLDTNLVVEVKKTGVEAITSTLTIQKVPSVGSGNYTCMPSNLHTASVILHVLNEKHPAAMQGERNGSSSGPVTQYYGLSILCILAILYNALYFDYNGHKKRTVNRNEPKKCDSTPQPISLSTYKKDKIQPYEWSEKVLEALRNEEDSGDHGDNNLLPAQQDIANMTFQEFPGSFDKSMTFYYPKTAKSLGHSLLPVKGFTEDRSIIFKESVRATIGLKKLNCSISSEVIIQPTDSNCYDQNLLEVVEENETNTVMICCGYRDLPLRIGTSVLERTSCLVCR